MLNGLGGTWQEAQSWSQLKKERRQGTKKDTHRLSTIRKRGELKGKLNKKLQRLVSGLMPYLIQWFMNTGFLTALDGEVVMDWKKEKSPSSSFLVYGGKGCLLSHLDRQLSRLPAIVGSTSPTGLLLHDWRFKVSGANVIPALLLLLKRLK